MLAERLKNQAKALGKNDCLRRIFLSIGCFQTSEFAGISCGIVPVRVPLPKQLETAKF